MSCAIAMSKKVKGGDATVDGGRLEGHRCASSSEDKFSVVT